MRTRTLRFELYADEPGLAWVRGIVEEAVTSRSARIVGESVTDSFPGSEPPPPAGYDILADQWAHEHPGKSSGTRRSLDLCVRVRCSLRTRRALRKAVMSGLCPAGPTPHVCRVPWAAGR